jgi:tetratricopeptide (TPR) repeat protein
MDWKHTADVIAAQIASLDASADPSTVGTLHATLGAALADGAAGEWTDQLVQQVLSAYATALDFFETADEAGLRLLTMRNVADTHFAAAVRDIGNARLHTEAAISFYERAVFDPAIKPEARDVWRRELGTVYAFAIERWEEILPDLSKGREPLRRADAQIALGGLHRVAGSVERAVTLLDDALEQVSAESTPHLWYSAHLHRGLACFARRHGDRDQNLSGAIRSLRIVRDLTSRDDQPREFLRIATAIAHAEIERGELAAAGASLESALTIDESSWSSDGWASTQLLVASLRLGMTPVVGTPLDDGEWPHDATADPFDAMGELRAEVASISSDEQIDVDETWRVPFLVYEDVWRLRQHLKKSIRAMRVWPRDAEARTSLEIARLEAHYRLFEQFTEALTSARRTGELFVRVAEGREGFALLLREFGTRATFYRRGSARKGSMREMSFIRDLAARIAPLPLVWIGNPADAQPRGHPNDGFRVDAGVHWKRDVRALVEAASFIVMENSAMSPGVLAEIDILRDARRLDDTLFSDPLSAADQLSAACQAMTDDRIGQLLSLAGPRSVAVLPDPACRWLEGALRQAAERDMNALIPWLAALGDRHHSVAAVDLALDAHAFVMSLAVQLERIDVLLSLCGSLGRTLAHVSLDDLPMAADLARIYAQLAVADG